MSASAKKKFRKQHDTAQMTEKQLNAQKEAKKLKAYTTVFVIAIVAVLVAALVFAGINIYTKSGIVEKKMVAATVNDEEINSVQLSYYYIDTINANYSQWKTNYGDTFSMFLSFMGLDPAKPLSEQAYDEELTWADHFIESAFEQAKSEYMLAAAAEAEGFSFSDADQLELDNTIATVTMYAMMYGYNDLETYLLATYGPGADEASYREYLEKSMLAAAYYEAHQTNLVVDNAAIRAYEEGRYNEFSSYSFATYHISYESYLTGGVESESGKKTYSDEEKQAARDAAMAEVERLTQFTTVDELNKAISKLAANKDSLLTTCTVSNNVKYGSVSTIYRDWLVDENRKTGDSKAFVYESTTELDENGNETQVANDYYVVLFLGCENNETKMANVRHILVDFKGGTTDENGVVTYTDEEKATAKADAEAILAELTADGTVTEEEFSDMAYNKSVDSSSSIGGLFENITPEDGVYVQAFKDWAMDASRIAGETGIIESEYGYHVMYYVSDAELNYRDYLIKEQVVLERMTEWYDGIMAACNATVHDTSRLNNDIVLNVEA